RAPGLRIDPVGGPDQRRRQLRLPGDAYHIGAAAEDPLAGDLLDLEAVLGPRRKAAAILDHHQRGDNPMAREAHPANGDQGRRPGPIEGRGELHLWMPRVTAAPEAAGVLVSFIAALQAILDPVQPAVEPAQDLPAARDPDQQRLLRLLHWTAAMDRRDPGHRSL